jgi:phage tail sheath protein FI
LVCPDIFYGYDGSTSAKTRIKQIQTAMIAHCENMQYRFAVLDTPPNLNAQEAKEWRDYVNFDTSYAAMYYPWIEVADLSDSPNTSKFMPPSGHVVGIYNRTDSERGVHKAPANEVILGATNLEIDLTKGEQDTLNPIGVNCIRSFPGRGIRVWGARTLSSDGSWRYINVRRLSARLANRWTQACSGWSLNPTTATCGHEYGVTSPLSCALSGAAGLCLAPHRSKPFTSSVTRNSTPTKFVTWASSSLKLVWPRSNRPNLSSCA